MPLVLLPLWYSSRLDTSCAPLNAQKGRHLRLLGGLKVTGSLVPLRQTALLTTFMEPRLKPAQPMFCLYSYSCISVFLALKCRHWFDKFTKCVVEALAGKK